ncbi:MAG: PocR ligand-binding domain-containing protein, partial [Syntrophomonadaceae bacterium]|nr:PocR ligand-binding domain-containing protein [Syntrophomonadaceae bacterium]
MTEENLTKTQLIDELIKLRQRNIELELALKEQERISRTLKEASPCQWFSTGRADLVVFNRTEHPPHVNPPVKYRLTDLVDISLLQQLLYSFYKATRIPYGLHDENNNILSGIGWQDICTRFHRVCPQSEYRCRQSDNYIYEHLHKGYYVGYKCRNGLMDFGTPIMIEGQHLASIFMGQILHEPPDEEFFCDQAKKYGFDEAAYMEALHRVPIIPREQVEYIMDFFSQLGNILAKLGLERKRQLEAAEQAVREQKEWFSQVWETSNEGFWEGDIETGQLYYSPRWAEIFGYLVEDSERSFQVFKKNLHPDDITATFKAIVQHLKGQTAKYEAEYRMLSKSGEWKWIMDRGQVVARSTEGKALRIVGTSSDITDRKKTESALLQTEQKFTKVFHCNPDPISISTLREGRYVEINDAFLDITGYKRKDVIDRAAQELNIWVNPSERDKMIKQVQENGSIRNYETKLRMKSSEIRIFEMSAEIIILDDEEHLIITYRDLSARKQMEEDLRLSEECLFKVFNTSPIVMGITTLEEGRFIKANKA